MKVLVPLFTALIAAGSFIRIPLPPVPITLQTLFLFIAALLLPARYSVYSVLLYLFIGIIGLPVFTTGGGLAAAIGPTGGYLWGMIPAVLAGSLIASQRNSAGWYVLSAVIADIVLYIPGVLWLMYSTGISMKAALIGGLLPFIPGDAVKIIIAAISAKALKGQILPLLERREE